MAEKTVELTRNEVPDQNASTVVPFNSAAMTERATEREVASRAAARLITDRDANTRTRRKLGLNSLMVSLLPDL